jgi:hypothetical protein
MKIVLKIQLPRPQRADSLLFREIVEPAGAALCGNPLPFTMQHQQQDQWCWSAVATSVKRFFTPATPWTQCILVNQALGEDTCCIDGSTDQCNQPWHLDRALQIVASFRAAILGKSPLATVQAEVNACRPLGIRIGWNGGGGHVVATFGYAGTDIYIGDPWYGDSVVDYAQFPASYQGGGTWTNSYFTQP